jgi:hypothetical protein
MYMQTIDASSAIYDFRRDFTALAKPGLDRYLRECGYDPDEPPDGLDDCWGTGQAYVCGLWRYLKSHQGLAELGEPWDATEAGKSAGDYEADMILTRKKGGLKELEFEPDIALYHKMGLGYQWRPKPAPEWYNQIPSVKRSNERQLERERQFDKAAGVARAEAPEPNPDVEAQKRDDLLLSSWLKRELPPRDYLLGDIMSTTSRWIIYGETGVGKTLFAMDMAGAIASGRGMLNWAGSGVTRRVMYLDGELPAETFKERMEIVARQYGPDIELYGYCRDILGDDDMPPLNKPEGAKWLEKECRTIQPEVIVFDSIMCLLTGNMAAEESWAPITPMLRQISQQRCAQIWLHHTGHDSSKGFGTKTREWQMDTVLSLTKDAQNDEHLLMEFKKARLRTPDTRAQFEPLKITCGADGWETVGGVDKRRGAPGDRGAARARAFMEAYDRLACDVLNSAGFNGKPVKKVALEAIRKEMRSRGALGDSTPGVMMTSGEYKAFDRAKEANTESKRLIEADGFVWR